MGKDKGSSWAFWVFKIFSSKYSAYHRGMAEGDSFRTATYFATAHRRNTAWGTQMSRTHWERTDRPNGTWSSNPRVETRGTNDPNWIKSLFCFLRFYLFIFRERGREGEREGEKHQCVVLPFMCPLLGTWPATQASALTGGGTATRLFAGLCSIHWATPARAGLNL